MKKTAIILLISILSNFHLHAQEYEVPLSVDFQLNKAFKKKQNINSGSKSMVSLPFLDDFSSDKFPGNSAGNTVLWESTCARLNETFPINAPTLGVITFDGLSCDGYPYNYESVNSYGRADTLTSTDIDLSTTSGSVVMSFLYQARGWGNQPETTDSLVLEFFHSDSSAWNWVWSSPGKPLSEFEQVLLPIEDSIYLESDFKFRFVNYATLSGALDHWNLDYVHIDDNRSLDDTVLQDLAYFEPQYTLLNQYSSVPWDHFDVDLMRDDILLQVKNNNTNGALQTNNLLEAFENGISQGSSLNSSGSPSIPGGNIQGYNYEVAANIQYDPSIPDEACFDVEFSFTVSPDFIVDNNRLTFQQKFTDYYAFDDGSAERGYGVDQAGGQVAYKFNFLEGDSISALYMYFLPVAEDPSDEQFFLTIWDHNSALDCPNEIIHQDNIAAPSFVDYQVAPDYFLVYPLQQKVFANAGETLWIGWQQSGDLRLNIGNDKNSNNNLDRLKYNVNGNWISSSIEGTLMMRPAVGSIPVVGLNELEESAVNVYPNPSDGLVYFDLPDIQGNWNFELFNISGQRITEGALNRQLDLSEFEKGVFWIRLTNPYLAQPINKKVVLVR